MTVALWVIGVVIGVCVVFAVIVAFAAFKQGEKRALGLNEYIKPVYDVRLWPDGPVNHFYVEAFHNGNVAFRRAGGGYKVVKNAGLFGIFGGKEEPIDFDNVQQVGGVYFYGREQVRKMFELKESLVQSEIDHWKQQAELYQHLAEQRRHDPQTAIEKDIVNIQELAKAAMIAAPKTGSSGGKKR